MVPVEPAKAERWAGFARTIVAAICGAALALFTQGKAEGRAEARLDTVVLQAGDHEGRLRVVENQVLTVATDVKWLRAALATGRDPSTGRALPIAKPDGAGD